MATIGKFKPFRGFKNNANEIILESGEVFFEMRDDITDHRGITRGKIKMGDGTTPYPELPYFLGNDITGQLLDFDDVSDGDGDVDLTKIEPNKPIENIFHNLKVQLYNIINKIIAVNNDLSDQINDVNTLASGKADGVTGPSNVMYAKGLNLSDDRYIQYIDSYGSYYRARISNNVQALDETDHGKSRYDLMGLTAYYYSTFRLFGYNSLGGEQFTSSESGYYKNISYPDHYKSTDYRYILVEIAMIENNVRKHLQSDLITINDVTTKYHKKIIYDFTTSGSIFSYRAYDIEIDLGDGNYSRAKSKVTFYRTDGPDLPIGHNTVQIFIFGVFDYLWMFEDRDSARE